MPPLVLEYERAPRAKTFLGTLFRTRSLLPLAETLRQLEIDIIDSEAVRKYKREKLKQVFQKRFDLYCKTYGSMPHTSPTGEYTSVEIAMWDRWCRQHRVAPEDRRSEYFKLPHALVAISFAWQPVTIFDPRQGWIPEHVQNKMAQIHERLPDATIEVEVLTDKTHAYDPLAKVTFGGEGYYFEVWDEKGLEDKRIDT